MKKNIIYLFIALTLVSLSLILMPHVSAQIEDTNLKVLNYSYHIDYSQGILVVVGEVQNTGSSTLSLNNVLVSGSVYTADGINHGDSSGHIYSTYLVPGQKMPFEILFNAPKSSPDGTWLSIAISRIDFKVNQATAVNNHPYPDVKITSQSSSIDTTALTRVPIGSAAQYKKRKRNSPKHLCCCNILQLLRYHRFSWILRPESPPSKL